MSFIKTKIILLAVLTCNAIYAGSTDTNGSSTNYSSGGSWTSGVPNLTFWSHASVTANVKHDLTYSGNLSATNKQNLIVHNGATLRITGNLNLGNLGKVTVLAGANLIVQGKITLGTNSTFSTSGNTSVAGNIEMSSSAKPTFGGSTTVGGDFIGNGAGTRATVSGTLVIDGQLNLQTNATMNGTGIVQWGTAYIYWSGFSYLYCNNGNRYGTDGWGHTDPPANPIDLASCSAATLSVDLLSFRISKNKDVISFEWITSNEIDAAYFEVLISKDGTNWESLLITNAKGYSNEISTYRMDVNRNQLSGFKYYRLAETDINDKKNVFRIYKLNITDENLISFHLIRNNNIIITHKIKAENIVLQITDLHGIVVSEVNSSNPSGSISTVTFPKLQLNHGIYFVRVMANDSQTVKKIYL